MKSLAYPRRFSSPSVILLSQIARRFTTRRGGYMARLSFASCKFPTEYALAQVYRLVAVCKRERVKGAASTLGAAHCLGSSVEVTALLEPPPPDARSSLNCPALQPTAFAVVVSIAEVEVDARSPCVPATLAHNPLAIARLSPGPIMITVPVVGVRSSAVATFYAIATVVHLRSAASILDIRTSIPVRTIATAVTLHFDVASAAAVVRLRKTRVCHASNAECSNCTNNDC